MYYLKAKISSHWKFGRLGAHFRNGNVGTEQDFAVEKIISHQSYRRPYGMAHDIAMLKLRNPVQFNRAVNLACLPESSGSVPDGKMCWVTGKTLSARVEGGGRWPCFIIQRDTAIPGCHPHIPKKQTTKQTLDLLPEKIQ